MWLLPKDDTQNCEVLHISKEKKPQGEGRAASQGPGMRGPGSRGCGRKRPPSKGTGEENQATYCLGRGAVARSWTTRGEENSAEPKVVLGEIEQVLVEDEREKKRLEGEWRDSGSGGGSG